MSGAATSPSESMRRRISMLRDIPLSKGYDPPEGWGWCYLDETMVELPDQTPQRGPIPRYY